MSEVKFRMTRKWYTTLRHTNIHHHTKFGIHTLNNVSYMLRTISFLKLGHRSRSRSQCPERVYDTHTTVEIPYSKKIEDMHQNSWQFSKLGQRSRSHWPKDGIHHSILHLHNEIGIPPSNNIRDMLQTRLFKKTRSEVKFRVTRKWYTALRHTNIHPHTKFGIPTLDNVRYMLRISLFLNEVSSRSQWPENGMLHSTISRRIHTPNFEFLPQGI